jgi:phosphatidylserine/phosphatidylglycerophosphate/cardiolipin synthase-like enzyme
VNIRFSKQYIIHAKVIIVDQQRAIIGSINLTRNSLESNRELAIITHDPKVLLKLIIVFKQDWKQANLSCQRAGMTT